MAVAERALRKEPQRLGEHEARMKEMNFSAAQRKRALDPLQSFSAQLEEEMEAYERARNAGASNPRRTCMAWDGC